MSVVRIASPRDRFEGWITHVQMIWAAGALLAVTVLIGVAVKLGSRA